MTKEDELVLGVARSDLPAALDWRGVRRQGIDSFLEAIERSAAYRRRDEVENDPSWKQVIPYLVLRDGQAWFLMRRSRAGGDARLFDRWSIGVGGHVNPGDRGLLGGLRREWREELDAAFEPRFDVVGLLNDDEDRVGAVHLGVVYVADARGRSVSVRERDKLEGGFVPTEGVKARYDRLETWSQLVFDALAHPDRGPARAPAAMAARADPDPAVR